MVDAFFAVFVKNVGMEIYGSVVALLRHKKITRRLEL
jgi:hypothetical protein